MCYSKTFQLKRRRCLVHSYGGFKEETLGLSWRIDEKGFVTGAIDLRGHGEHPLDLDYNINISISVFWQSYIYSPIYLR